MERLKKILKNFSCHPLIISITDMSHISQLKRIIRRKINDHPLTKKLMRISMGEHFLKDVKFRKHGSPVLSAAKAINLVAAMVSILSLETAMISQFGGSDDSAFRQAMTGATGGGVCTIVLGMAIYMIFQSSKDLKMYKINNLAQSDNEDKQ